MSEARRRQTTSIGGDRPISEICFTSLLLHTSQHQTFCQTQIGVVVLLDTKEWWRLPIPAQEFYYLKGLPHIGDVVSSSRWLEHLKIIGCVIPTETASYWDA